LSDKTKRIFARENQSSLQNRYRNDRILPFFDSALQSQVALCRNPNAPTNFEIIQGKAVKSEIN